MIFFNFFFFILLLKDFIYIYLSIYLYFFLIIRLCLYSKTNLFNYIYKSKFILKFTFLGIYFISFLSFFFFFFMSFTSFFFIYIFYVIFLTFPSFIFLFKPIQQLKSYFYLNYKKKVPFIFRSPHYLYFEVADELNKLKMYASFSYLNSISFTRSS